MHLRVTEVEAHNFRSFEQIRVDLDPLTVLVGQNASGKSNLLDVLRFTSESLRKGLDSAISLRRGISAIRRWSAKGRPYDVTVRVILKSDEASASYSFTVGSKRRTEFEVKNEACSITHRGQDLQYEIRNGTWVAAPEDLKKIPLARAALALPIVAAVKPFGLVYNALTGMRFYTIYPNVLREPQPPGVPYPLEEHGSNLASVLREMQRTGNQWLPDLRAVLKRIVPDIGDFGVRQIGGYFVVMLVHEMDTANRERAFFDLSQESDGTLRILGLLTALYQDPPPTLISIEEPELTVHPGVIGVLADVLKETAKRSQVLITTHSPDLMDCVPVTSIRVVERVKGVTRIGPVNKEQIGAVEDRLFTPGDILRLEGLQRGEE
ncbi:MAG: AAA family ATPase [Candidatus Thorarchaeota archaeon]|nr:AAA family ATPase [Candidatus Thorarchaeota archaeon]